LYFNKDTEVLDIGSGSGLIINKLLKEVKHITAVEKFEGFTKFIIDAPNMLVIMADLIGFKIRKQYDLVLCTGVSQCFKKENMIPIYKNMFSMVKEDGLFISRMHCGLNEDVSINGFSKELGTEYFADYRHLDKEIDLLKEIGFNKVEIFDIFPDTLNVWKNTRHFIFVCSK